MAKRPRPTSWQTPNTRMFLIQVQWSLAPSLDRDAVLTRIRQLVSDARATARIVFEQTAFAVDADDNEDPTQPFTDLTIEAADAAEFWAALQAMLSDPDIGSGLRQSTDILCDAPERKREAVSAAQPRLHHFDPSEPIDEFR